ncbi:hypothetical protein LZ30DRAFT_178326 [Colletotrichum cereale]|nr:hypothetical protein LZ30DRAFT_178326 [Colletotrichum cereale]
MRRREPCIQLSPAMHSLNWGLAACYARFKDGITVRSDIYPLGHLGILGFMTWCSIEPSTAQQEHRVRLASISSGHGAHTHPYRQSLGRCLWSVLRQTSGPPSFSPDPSPSEARPPGPFRPLSLSPLTTPPGPPVHFVSPYLFAMHCHRGSCGAGAPREPLILRRPPGSRDNPPWPERARVRESSSRREFSRAKRWSS